MRIGVFGVDEMDGIDDVKIKLLFDDVVNDDTPTNGLLLVAVVELLTKQ